MAWGGSEEQEVEHAAGNLNTKNWHDVALKVVKDAMQAYWKERPEARARPNSVSNIRNIT